MKTKDHTVETEFHPTLTAFLFEADITYRKWGSELIITSGSEQSAKHSRTSLHYATPAQAADIRIWQTYHEPPADQQLDYLKATSAIFCRKLSIPTDWIDIILESDHIHIEYQPKRIQD